MTGAPDIPGLPRLLRRTFIAAVATVAAAAALDLLYAAFCAFTWYRYILTDYGNYTNMIWNSGHGAWFRYLVDRSYLVYHLSFSLALLGPLFRIWDHPFLLAVVQWLILVAGAGTLLAAMHRMRMAPEMRVALLLFFTGYVFTQQVMLSEFHGTATYFLLVPLLYCGLVFRSRWAWIPFLLILGIREDAFLFILPMLLYFAVRERHRESYLLAGVAIAYGLLAVFVLYPAINGITLFQRRAESLGGLSALGLLDPESLARRGHALLWSLLPILPMMVRGAAPALIFPSMALLTSLLSTFWRQQGLLNHYPAPVMVCLAVGILEAVRCSLRDGRARLDGFGRAAALAAITLLFHFHYGYLPGGSNHNRLYGTVRRQGLAALRAARHAPREGLLLTQWRYAGLCANRAGLHVWDKYKGELDAIDVVFDRANNIGDPFDGDLLAQLRRDEFGAHYFDGTFVILVRHGGTESNARLLTWWDHRGNQISFPRTAARGGDVIYCAGAGSVRHWSGDGSRAPVTLSYGGARSLAAGSYFAVFRYRALPPKKPLRNSWGTFSVHYLNEREALSVREIRHEGAPPGVFLTLAVPFECDGARPVEVRVTGADSELFLDSALFVPADKIGPFRDTVDQHEPGVR